MYIAGVLSSIIKKIATDEELNRIQKFIDENKLQSFTQVKIAMENTKLNLQWSNKNIPAIKRFIQPKKLGKSGTTSQSISCLIFFSSIFIAFYQ